MIGACLLAVGVARADALRLGGTGSGSKLLEVMADAYTKRYPGRQVEVVMPPLGSGGGLRALAAGKLDMAVIARPLRPGETQAVKASEFARTLLVLATGTGKRPQGWSRDDLARLYGGEIVVWDDGAPLRLIMRSPHESDSQLIRSLTPDIAAAYDAALARTGMLVADHDLDAVEQLVRVPGAVGTTTLGLINTMRLPLRPLPLDGVTPSRENLINNRYALRKSYFLVTAARPSPAVEEFLTFLASEPARKLLIQSDYLPFPR